MDRFNHVTEAGDAVELDEPLLTAKQVAELLVIPRSTVYEYARRRHHPLPSIEVGRHRRFHRSEVCSWLSQHRRS